MVGYAIEEGSQYAKKLSKRDREDKGQVTDFFLKKNTKMINLNFWNVLFLQAAKNLYKSMGGNTAKLLQHEVVEDWELRDLEEYDHKPVKDSLRDEQLDERQVRDVRAQPEGIRKKKKLEQKLVFL